ncbi:MULTISPECIES: hypothetical protein [Proteus]|nr:MULTISPECIES: hypothetical protein [Proteus]MCH4253872.1 hypothetical protein [Proteus vulgaris]UWT99123.1 hypothetical protein N1711_11430 [Proteus vulgaris]
MNKEHWISIDLASNFDESELKSLIAESYKLTQ